MIESWNPILSKNRRRLIIELLKFMLLKMMTRLIRRREKAEQWDIDLPSRIHKKLVKIVKLSKKLVVFKATSDEFEVIDYVLDSERHYIINLEHRS